MSSEIKLSLSPNKFLRFIGWILFLIGTFMIGFGIISVLSIFVSQNINGINILANLGVGWISLFIGFLFSITGSLNIIAGKSN